MQIAFNVWSEIVTDNTELKNELFTFFFMASCFIAIKVLISKIIFFLVGITTSSKVSQELGMRS